MKNRSILSGILLIMFVLTACGGNAPVSTPTVDPSAVAAVVSTMLAANATATPLPEPTATLTPETPTVLPRSLYYLAQDANGKWQIYRLSRDGVTITQITFEREGLSGFDVSLADGMIAYTVQNKLITVDANGANNQTLLQDSSIEYLLRPIWSVDGKTIAYYNGKDVLTYSFDLGKSEVLLGGSDIDIKFPVSFSPDSRKLIIGRQTPGSRESEILIYDFATQTLTSLVNEEGQSGTCYGDITWDTSSTFFCSNHVLAGSVLAGLWHVNATDGSVETLIETPTGDRLFSLVAAPRQDTVGNLYYLFELYDIDKSNLGFSLVRSNADDIASQITLRQETFNVLDAMWTPDGNDILILQYGGINNLSQSLILVPADSSLPVVTIISDANGLTPSLLRWGL